MAEISVDTGWGRPSRAPLPLRAVGDDRLARLAARGDRRAFAEIYRRYHQPLFRYCHSILRSDEDAQDALQNTMAAAIRGLDGEGRQIALKPWLYRIAHNESIDLMRRRRPEVDLAVAADFVAHDDGVATRARLRQLLEDLGELPEKQRAALVMRELNGLEYAEIGAAFGISAAAATQTVYDARRGLQELSEGRDLPCEDVQYLLSQRDGRLLKARKVRGHLRSCAMCQAFQASISERTRDLAALSPALPATVAASLLSGLLGGGGGGAGGGGIGGLAAGAKAGGATIGFKSVAVATVVATAGTGAAFEFDALTVPESQAHKRPAVIAAIVPPGAAARGSASFAPLASAAAPLRKIDRLDDPAARPGAPGSAPSSSSPDSGSRSDASVAPTADPADLADRPLASVPALSSPDGGGASETPAAAPAPEESDPAPPARDEGAGTGPGNANGNGQGNANGQANGNANGQGNGNANGQGNGNANGQGNGNANGQGNGNANGQGNGNANGQGNGNGNGNAQGQTDPPGQANGQGNGNGQANGNANGHGNGNAQANGNGNGNGRGNSGKKPDDVPTPGA